MMHRFVSWIRYDADQYELFLFLVAVPVTVLFCILGGLV